MAAWGKSLSSSSGLDPPWSLTEATPSHCPRWAAKAAHGALSPFPLLWEGVVRRAGQEGWGRDEQWWEGELRRRNGGGEVLLPPRPWTRPSRVCLWFLYPSLPSVKGGVPSFLLHKVLAAEEEYWTWSAVDLAKLQSITDFIIVLLVFFPFKTLNQYWPPNASVSLQKDLNLLLHWLYLRDWVHVWPYMIL